MDRFRTPFALLVLVLAPPAPAQSDPAPGLEVPDSIQVGRISFGLDGSVTTGPMLPLPAPPAPAVDPGYRKNGESAVRSDGASLSRAGNEVLSSEGISYRRVGDSYFSSDGRSYRISGGRIIGSDGQLYQWNGGILTRTALGTAPPP